MAGNCVLILILFSVVSFSESVENEPVSSQLYDILEKMSKIEGKIEKWEKEREIFQETVLSVLEHRKEEMQRSFDIQSENFKKIHGDYEEMRNEITNKTKLLETHDTQIVAFNAYSTTGGIYGDNQVVLFPIVLLNNGDGYNKDTSYFIAPVSGLYFFSAHICHLKAISMVISIVHMKVKIATTTEYENVGNSCSSVSAPAVLKAGEYVYIRSSYSNSHLIGDKQYRWPSFTGVLVQTI